ncbi:alpha/beta hydrolase [candidate division KSB1 bacterium]|nr:alpha/beta hydrolase [candidate division KSB1 bacterium]
MPHRAWFNWLRLSFAILIFSLSLLSVFRAPTNFLWKLAIGATEWGHILAAMALLTLLPGWRRSRKGWIAGVFGIVAAVLSLTPLMRATLVARQLPKQLHAAFIKTTLLANDNTPARPEPFVAVDLLRGVDSPEVDFKSLAYSQVACQTLRLDLYQSFSLPRPAPCVIVIHGGSWRSGDSQQLSPLNTYLAARGYVVAAINYRLAPRWRFPAARDDLIAALNFLKARADSLGIDSQRFALLGRSAGGELALLVAYTQHDPAIRGVVSFYGPTDMYWSWAHPGNPLVIDTHDILKAYLGGSPQEFPENYNAASPIQFVNASAPPTLLIHGGRDELVSPRQSERLAERLAEAGVHHFVLRLPWATHAGDFNFSGPFGQISTYAIEHFLIAITSKR